MFKNLLLQKKTVFVVLLLVGVLVCSPLLHASAATQLLPAGSMSFTVSKGSYTTGIAPNNVVAGSTVTLLNGQQVTCYGGGDWWIVFNNVPQSKIMPDQANVLRIWSTNAANQEHINRQNPPAYGGLTGYLGCTNGMCDVVLCGKNQSTYPYYPWVQTDGWSMRLEIPSDPPLVITNPSAVSTGLWVTQCISGGRQRVWRVDSNPGRATYLYSENQYDYCGAGGTSPLKFRTAYPPAGVWITWCAGSGHVRYVWKTDGSQYAPFQYPEATSACP
jgi:hypothetical protein